MTEVQVVPITIGYRFGHSVRFRDVDGEPLAGLNLTTAQRVYGQFRASAENEGVPYAIVDTSDGTIEVVDANTLSFSISEEKTSAIPPGNLVWVDFSWFDGATWYPIPVRIGWPVVDPVTIPPV